MEPTSANPNPNHPPAAAPPAVGQGLVEYVRTSRDSAAYVFLGLAALFVVLTGFLAMKAYASPPKPAEAAEKGEKEGPDAEKKDARTGETEAQVLNRTQYSLGWITSMTVAGICGVGGAWLLLRPVAPTESEQRSEARVMLLTTGGLIGALVIVLGCAYFYVWSDSLTNWLNKGEVGESKWVIYPLLMVVFGAALVFLAIQPARAEERNSQTIRKLVYGANFALTVLLLVVALLIANVVFSLKVPNKLDTTATGFYALSDTTKNLLSRLNEPVTAYAILPGEADRLANDIRQLLLACNDASGGKFKVKFLSPVSNAVEIATLQKKYPQLDLVLNQRLFSEDEVAGAVVLTTGEDEKRHVVIPAREFSANEGRQVVFQGEARLFKELAFLSDAEGRPNVYFTQGHGELNIEPGRNVPPTRSATRLKTYLENSYFTVKSVNLAGDNPAVPDDATVVVVADPTTPLADPAVSALRKYMFNPAKKGKLVVLAGANIGPDRKLIKNGLEGLLAELNVKLGTRFIFNVPTPQFNSATSVIGAFTAEALQNPALRAVVTASPRMQLMLPREVEPVSTSPTFQVSELMVTDGRTWTEQEVPADLGAIIEEMVVNLRAQAARGVSNAERPVAVTVSEGQSPRAVVIGSATIVSDEVARRIRSQSAPLSFDLIGVSIDWLREKPSITAANIESKKYGEYQFPRLTAEGGKERKTDVDETRLKYVPLALAFVAVLGLGAGVWVIRRR